MGSRPHRLSLDEILQLRWFLGGILMLLSIATVFYLDIGSEWLAILSLAGVTAALVKPDLPACVPLIVHRLAFPAILAFFAADLWRSGELLPAVVRLDLLLLLYRGISHRARRDDLQIIVLGLFLIVVAGVLTVSLLFAGQILVYTGCALAFLMVVTIAASTEGGNAPALAVRRVVPPWAAQVEWVRLFRRLWEVSDWRLIALAVVAFLGIVGLSGVLFLAIPRFQLENTLFLDRLMAKRAMTGFSDSIRFGDITEIQQDDSIAMDVDLSDPTQAPANPYWRMVVLDDYHDGAFKLSSKLRAAFSRDRPSAYIRTSLSAPASAPVWTFYLASGVSRYLPLLGPFALLRFRDVQNFRYSQGLGLVALRDEPSSMTPYRVEGMNVGASELSDVMFAGWWRRRRVPSSIPLQLDLDLSAADKASLAKLAAEIGPPGEDVETFARREGAWLRNLHGYSLAPRIPPGPGDPLVRWMKSRESGHCELFAGAMVLLARSAGYPARVVTGFKGGTWNAFSGNFTIRNSDAHAWAEIWDAKNGSWLRADALAATVQEQSEQKGAAALAGVMDRSWSARLNSLRVFWYRRIVNFDQQSQADTLRAVKNATDTSGKWLRSALEGVSRRLKQWAAGPWDRARLTLIAGAAAALVLAAWLFRALRWRLGPVVRGRRANPIRREAGRWLARLEGPPALVADLQRLRYGPSATWPRPAEVFKRARRAPPSSRRRARGSSRSIS